MSKLKQGAEWKIDRVSYHKLIAGVLAVLFFFNQGIPVSFAAVTLEEQVLNQTS